MCAAVLPLLRCWLVDGWFRHDRSVASPRLGCLVPSKEGAPAPPAAARRGLGRDGGALLSPVLCIFFPLVLAAIPHAAHHMTSSDGSREGGDD